MYWTFVQCIQLAKNTFYQYRPYYTYHAFIYAFESYKNFNTSKKWHKTVHTLKNDVFNLALLN